MEIDDYSAFWDFYVSEHRNPLNRFLHFIGTTLAMVLLVWFIVSDRFLFVPLVLVAGYGFAWVGHFFVEKNKPASFKYPFWSFISDFKMWFFMLTGRMNREVERVKAGGDFGF